MDPGEVRAIHPVRPVDADMVRRYARVGEVGGLDVPDYLSRLPRGRDVTYALAQALCDVPHAPHEGVQAAVARTCAGEPPEEILERVERVLSDLRFCEDHRRYARRWLRGALSEAIAT